MAPGRCQRIDAIPATRLKSIKDFHYAIVLGLSWVQWEGNGICLHILKRFRKEDGLGI